MNRLRITGRGWAYVGALLGGAVSIAANVAHSYVPPAGAPVSWSPPAGAVAGAVFWPVALFVAIEILARVRWHTGARWVLLRFGGLVPVAVVAALVSYRHLSGLLDFYGEDRMTVVLGPLAVDGLMVMATAALVATSRQESAEKTTPSPVAAPDLDDASENASLEPHSDPEQPPAEAARTRARSSTAEPRVQRAVTALERKLGRQPTAAEVAVRAGVSESTARRYMTATVPSPTGPDAAETRVNGADPQLAEVRP